MNAESRKAVQSILNDLCEIDTQIEAFKGKVEQLQEEEQEKFDNLSAGLQASERGQLLEQAAAQLASAIDYLESAVSAVTDACSELENLE